METATTPVYVVQERNIRDVMGNEGQNMIISDTTKNELYQLIKTTPAFNRLGPIENPSGVKDPFVVEVATLLSGPQKAKVIGRVFGEIARQFNADLLAGIATSAIPLVAVASVMSDIPFVYIRKERDRRTGQIIEGNFKKGTKALLVDDMIGDGGEKERVIKEIGSELEIENLLVLWESHESEHFNWPTKMQKLKLNVIPIFNWSELVKRLHNDGILSKEATEIFDDWLRHVGKWSDNKEYWTKFENYRLKYQLQKGDNLV